jgi:hypothetical protein
MTDKQKIEILKQCFENTIWMAIRYADEQRTYAPEMVRESIKDYQRVFPEWKPKEDPTIKPPIKDELTSKHGDSLYDLFK